MRNDARPRLGSAWTHAVRVGVTGVAISLGATCWAGAVATPAATSRVLDQAPPVRAVVSIPPLQGLVQELVRTSGLSLVDDRVEVLIPPGVSEHGYEIPPSKLASLNRATLVVIIGLGMEPQVEKMLTARPSQTRRVVTLASALGIKPGHEHDHHDHAPGEACNHSVDPHVWLDPVQVEKAVSAIAEQLRASVSTDADAAKRIWRAEEALITKVKAVHSRYEQVLRTTPPLPTRVLVVGHDAWQHLAKRYALETVAIKGLNAGEPTPESISAAKRAVSERGARAVCVEPQLNPDAGKRVAAAAGVPVRVIDPLGTGDWFAMMEQNLREIAGALGAEYPPAPSEAPESAPAR